MGRILYFECKTGAAGDMLMGALYGLLSEEQQALFLNQLNGICEDITVTAERKIQKGIGGIHMKVEVQGMEEDHHHHEHSHDHHHEHEHSHDHGHHHEHEHSHDHDHHHEHEHSHDHDHHHEHEHSHDHDHHHEHEHSHDHDHHHEHEHSHEHHHHTSYQDVLQLIGQLPFSENVKKNAAEVYRLIGEAESKVHCTTMEQIHFHEVGSLDALIDVVGSSLAIEMLQVDKIICSPVCVGNGTVRCAHGVLPVPAPATAEIVKGMPIYFSETDGELLTPTGAAVLKYFAESYAKSIAMEIEAIGYGMGTREYEDPSFVRAFLGTE